MKDAWNYLAVALLSGIAVFVALKSLDEVKPSTLCPADCDCSTVESEATGRRGWRAEAAAINKRVEALEARLIPGLRPGSVGESPN